jgi:nucleoside-diphosphate-sugar epimerase
MERWCLKRAQSSGRTRIVVLCPSCVYGPGGDAYTTLPIRLARNGGLCWIDGGRGTANYNHVENLVDAMLLAATELEAHGRRFIVNDGAVTWREFLGQLLGDDAAQMPSYSASELHALHRQRRRPTLADVARVAMANQDVRTTLRETRVGGAALWSAEHATPGVIVRMRRRWHSHKLPTGITSGAATVDATHGSGLPPLWLADLYGPATTVFRSDTARNVLGWIPRVSLDEGMRVTRHWVDAEL